MTSATTATLQVTYSEQDNNTTAIILQQMIKRFDLNGVLWVRCFSATEVTFVASVGSIKIGNTLPQYVYTESLKFSNSSSASLQFPGAFDVKIRDDGVKLEQVFDEDKKLTGIELTRDAEFSFDEETNSVIVTDKFGSRKNIYGACSVSYTVLYTILYYTPDAVDIHGGGIAITVGSIFAYNDKTVEVLDLEIEPDSNEWVEFARVTSKIVLDDRGVWEFPDNWNSTYSSNKGKDPDQKSEYENPGTYNNFSYEIDSDACFVDTRVHLIIYINTFGFLKEEDFNNGGDDYWAWFNPYFGYSTYDPVYELTWAAPPGGEKAGNSNDFEYDLNHTTWRDIFLSVDKNELLSELQKEYPGVTAGNKGRQ